MKYVKHLVLEKTSNDDDDEFKFKYGAEKDKVIYDAELFKIYRGRDEISYNEYEGSKSMKTKKFKIKK
jgi:hypothetical protein